MYAKILPTQNFSHRNKWTEQETLRRRVTFHLYILSLSIVPLLQIYTYKYTLLNQQTIYTRLLFFPYRIQTLKIFSFFFTHSVFHTVHGDVDILKKSVLVSNINVNLGDNNLTANILHIRLIDMSPL